MPLYIVIPVNEKLIPVGNEVRPGLKVISYERKPAPTGSKMAWWYQVTPSKVVENNQESELLSCPNPHCGDPDNPEIHIDVSGCFVVCNGCGMCGPECAPGDWNTTNDKERKKAAIGLWNDLPRKEYYMEEPITEIDYNLIHKPIRNLVKLLNENGFKTTDSGDGTTNIENGMGCALDVPNIFIKTTKEKVISDPIDILKLLKNYGAKVNQGDIQSIYDPIDDICIVSIFNITDASIGIAEE